MVLNVHRNHKAYQGRGEGGMEVGEKQARSYSLYMHDTDLVGQSSGAVCKSMWPFCDPVPNKPYGFCGRKATLNLKTLSEFMSCVKV